MDQHERRMSQHLASFTQSFFLPALQATIDHELDSDLSRGQLLEVIVLLDLGIELGVFSTAEAQKVANEIPGSVLADLDEFLTNWAFVFASDGVPLFGGLLADGITFGDRVTGYSRASPLSIPFRDCLLRSRRLFSDPLVLALTKVIAFERSNDVWKSLMLSVDPQLLSEYLNLTSSPKYLTVMRGTLIAGLFRILEYIDDTRQSWTMLFGAQQYDGGAILQLLHDFSRAQVWRMNLWNPYVQTRVDELLTALVSDANEELVAIGARIRARDLSPNPEVILEGFLSKTTFDELLINWKTRTKTNLVSSREIADKIMKTEPGFSAADVAHGQLIERQN